MIPLYPLLIYVLTWQQVIEQGYQFAVSVYDLKSRKSGTGLASRYITSTRMLSADAVYIETYHQERIASLTFSIPWNETRGNEGEGSVDASTIKRPVLRLSDSEPGETFFISASWTSGGREWSGDTCARNLEHVSRAWFDDDFSSV